MRGYGKRTGRSLRWHAGVSFHYDGVWQAALGTAPDDARWAYSIMNSILANRLALTPFVMRIGQALKVCVSVLSFLKGKPAQR